MPARSEPSHISQAKNLQHCKTEKKEIASLSNHMSYPHPPYYGLVCLHRSVPGKSFNCHLHTLILVFLELSWPNRTKGLGFHSEQEDSWDWFSMSSHWPSQLMLNSHEDLPPV